MADSLISPDVLIRDWIHSIHNLPSQAPAPCPFPANAQEDSIKTGVNNLQAAIPESTVKNTLQTAEIGDSLSAEEAGQILFSAGSIATGKAEWRESTFQGYGIAGVYNPATGKAEWRESTFQGYGIAGVYNPATGKAEWKQSTFQDYGIAGVYNAATGKAEWKQSTFQDYRIAGVYNAATGKAEWKQSMFKGYGVAGVYVPDKTEETRRKISEKMESGRKEAQQGAIVEDDEWLLVDNVRIPVKK